MDPHDSYDPSEPTTQMASRSVSRFCTDDRRVSLYFTMGRPFPPPSKLSLPMGLCGSHLTHGSLGPPESSAQMAAFFAGLTSVTDRQTDRQTDRHTTLLGR